MQNQDARVLLPGWEVLRQLRSGGRENVYEIFREKAGSGERSQLTVVSIPAPRRDAWADFSRAEESTGQIPSFNSEMRSCAAEFARVRALNGENTVLKCQQALFVQQDDGRGWDALIRTEMLPPLVASMQGGPLTEEKVLQLSTDLCLALLAGERAGLPHRNVCPANVYVGGDGTYKLGGYGMACLLEKNGGRSGQPEFMAPEVHRGELCGHSGDICSLGLVMYWLLNEGRAPFLQLPPVRVTEDDREQAVLRRLRGEAVPPPAHGSEALKRIVLKAVAADPRSRYTSAAEMLKDLAGLQKDKAAILKAVAAAGGAAGEKTGVRGFRKQDKPAKEKLVKEKPVKEKPVKAAVERAEEKPAGEGGSKKKKGMLIGIGGGAVAVAAIALILLLGHNKPPVDPRVTSNPETETTQAQTEQGQNGGENQPANNTQNGPTDPSETPETTEPTTEPEGGEGEVTPTPTGDEWGHEHIWSKWRSNGDGTHSRTCSAKNCPKPTETEKCEYDEEVITEPTCTELGSKKLVCKVCGYAKTEDIKANGHTWGAWTSKSDTHHSHTCSVEGCGVEEEEPHTFGAEQVTAATCENDGVRQQTCSVCGFTKFIEVVTTKLGHDWGDWETIQEPAVGVPGIKKRTCQRPGCSAYEEGQIDPLPDPSDDDTTSILPGPDGAHDHCEHDCHDDCCHPCCLLTPDQVKAALDAELRPLELRQRVR